MVLMVNLLLVLIHLLLAEEHAVKGEQAGGAVAQHKLRWNVEPAGQPRVVHARVQRARRHVEVGVGCQIDSRFFARNKSHNCHYHGHS